jgi:hypothetical protein
MQHAPAPVDEQLSAALARGDAGPFPVMVVFREDQPADRLARLGLSGAGRVGLGQVDAPTLASLSQLSEVESIHATGAAPAAPSPDGERFPPTVTAALAAQLQLDPAGRIPIYVTFNTPKTAEEILALGLGGDGVMASGVLDAAAIRALAARPDVASVDYRPPQVPTGR